MPLVVAERLIALNDTLWEFHHKLSTAHIHDPIVPLGVTGAEQIVPLCSNDHFICAIESQFRFHGKIAQPKAIECAVWKINNIGAIRNVCKQKVGSAVVLLHNVIDSRRVTERRVKRVARRIEQNSTVLIKLPFCERRTDNAIRTRRPSTSNATNVDVVAKTTDRLLINELTHRQANAHRRRRRQFRLRCGTNGAISSCIVATDIVPPRTARQRGATFLALSVLHKAHHLQRMQTIPSTIALHSPL
jgi:hypothetical protein